MSKIGRDTDDRAIGEYWEDTFCGMCRSRGWEEQEIQRKRGSTFISNGVRYICPDVWILKRQDRQYACEIKHKTVSVKGFYGFELYRSQSLLSLQRDYSNQFGGVTSLYVVHNWAMNGDKRNGNNHMGHWFAQRMDFLDTHKEMGESKTLYNGHVTENPVPICYYHVRLFQRLTDFI